MRNPAVVMMFLKTLKPSGGRRSWSSFKENSLNLKILSAIFIVLHKKEPVSTIEFTTELSNLVLS